VSSSTRVTVPDVLLDVARDTFLVVTVSKYSKSLLSARIYGRLLVVSFVDNYYL